MLAVDHQTIVGWVRRLIAFDSKVFEDIRGNPTATVPAVLLVVVSMLFTGLGGWLWWSITQGYGGEWETFRDSALIGSLIAVALWGVIWVGLVYFFLTQFFRERVFLEQLLRVMGLATAPMALTVFMVIPGVSFAIALGALVLTFGLTSIAIQSVTNADPLKIVVANVAGFAVWAAFLTIFVSSNHVYGPGIFVFDWPAELSGALVDQINEIKNIVQP